MKECKVFLKPKKEESLLRFHPWVFSGAIQTIEGEPEEGDLVEVYGTNGRFLGIGHYQIGSIAVRILSFKPVTIDAAFWEERIRIAYTLRQTLELAGVENNNTYRLVHVWKGSKLFLILRAVFFIFFQIDHFIQVQILQTV